MAEIFKDKIQFKAITVKRAQELAASNFKLHTSVEYLDLSRNTNLLRNMHPSSCRAVFTKEGFLKRVIPERKILYDFHLDLPRNLESLCCENRTEVVSERGFHVKEVSVLSTVYNRDFATYIVANIQNSREKVEKLRNYLNTLELLNFREDYNANIYLCDYVLQMLNKENCTDAELLRNFLTLFDFTFWLSRIERPRILEYVLLQAQRVRCTNHLWQFLNTFDPATFCFFKFKVWYMYLLIRYGTITSIPSEVLCGRLINRFINPDIPAIINTISYTRAYRVYQLFSFHRFHHRYPKALRCLWRSIKDPFLSTNEIDTFLGSVLSADSLRSLHLYHVKYIISEGNSSSTPVPRKLKDLCRVEVRRCLSYNHQVPFGIYGLDIPEILKQFLNLRI